VLLFYGKDHIEMTLSDFRHVSLAVTIHHPFDVWFGDAVNYSPPPECHILFECLKYGVNDMFAIILLFVEFRVQKSLHLHVFPVLMIIENCNIS